MLGTGRRAAAFTTISDFNMGKKAEEFRAIARELEERAQGAIDPTARSTLLDVAQRWRRMARCVDEDGHDAAPSIIPTKSENGD
jgi:hypothetical protein